jgi:hypothetical protein
MAHVSGHCPVGYLVEQQLVPYARARALLADLCGAEVSLGTRVRWMQQAAATLEPVEAQITAALRRAPVLHSDVIGAPSGRAGLGAWTVSTPNDRLRLRCAGPAREGSRAGRAESAARR